MSAKFTIKKRESEPVVLALEEGGGEVRVIAPRGEFPQVLGRFSEGEFHLVPLHEDFIKETGIKVDSNRAISVR